MLSDQSAGELRFAGFGSQGSTAAEAGQRLAEALQRWMQQHEHCRVVQISVQPAGVSGMAQPFGLGALVVYLAGTLDSAAEAEAVATAVEELQKTQTERRDPEPPRFV
ncbi:MAG TPA: hypothetical protein VKV26_18610 [Dehalococcoidia bacterium]|nr:hypothetical protein [Dehalococcoidia bacterium]